MEPASGGRSNSSYTVEERTRCCLDRIKNRGKNEPARVIVLLGRIGVGKSSLVEYLVDAVGEAEADENPVTTRYQLEELTIDGKQYFLMDTPGFDAGSELATFDEIARGINAIRPHARIVGVLYVTKINNSRIENIDRELLKYTQAFCGNGFTPRITIVTTHWNSSQDREKEKLSRNLEAVQQLWNKCLIRGAKSYQHGREYNLDEDTGVSLCWPSDRPRIAEYGRNMISRHYADTFPLFPRIVRELDEDCEPRHTSAARLFDPNQESTRASFQGVPREQSVQNRAFQPEEEPARTASPNAGKEGTSRSLFQSCIDLATAVVNKTSVNWTPSSGGPFTGDSTRPAAVQFGGPAQNFQLDPNSVVDLMKSRGMDSSLAGRQALANDMGINVGPLGSARQNNALLEALRM